MNTKFKWIIGITIVLVIILGFVLIFINSSAKKRLTPQNDTTLYDSFDIPSGQVPYPEGWPQDLHYPQQMVLVYARGSKEAGWESALTYSGTAKEASDILESFFVSNGWEIADRTIVDDDNLGFFIGRDDKQGVIIIGSDPSTNTVKIVLNVDE